MSAKRPDFDHDRVDRTILIGMVNGSQPTLEAGLAARGRFTISITADDLSTRPRQAALFAAIAASVRIAGTVAVIAPDAELARQVLGGTRRGSSIAEAAIEEGARLGAHDPSGPIVEILVGCAVTATVAGADAVLRLTWAGWTARVHPDTGHASAGIEDNTLAAICAAALAVHEAFGIFAATPGRDDGYRSIALNLWDPNAGVTDGPPLQWVPAAWWLVGLGHLGQANAWVLAWLGLPAGTEITLQDDGVLSDANHSTGILTPEQPAPERKTRQAARSLEAIGLTTRIIEQRYSGLPVPQNVRHSFALFGVDSPHPRREISRGDWAHTIDVGLGTGPNDFDAILVRRFPGRIESADIPGWQEEVEVPVEIPATPAFDRLRESADICGVTELAGTAVGASFVGLVGAAVAIAEAVRSLHQGQVHELIRIDLGPMLVRAIGATSTAEPAAIQLETP